MDNSKRILFRKDIFSWCLYDWANSAFVLIVVTGFFPIMFRGYYGAGDLMSPGLATMRLGMGNTVAGVFIAVLSLLLGVIGGRRKKRYLGFFVFMGALSTLALALASQGQWKFALACFVLGNIGFSCANLFYDALLVDVANEKEMDRVSSAGFALGYVGSVMLFGFCLWMTMSPETFGLANDAVAARVSFAAAAVWWVVFSIPLFLWVRENAGAGDGRTQLAPTGLFASVMHAVREIRETSRSISKKSTLIIFLCAYWLYFDGVNTFIRMSVNFGISIGFGPRALMVSLIIVQIIAFPSALLFGHLATRFGAARMIGAGVFIYIAISAYGSVFMRTETQFIVLAAISGVAQGGIQALSRSYYGKIIPAEKSAEYFGFYNVVSRFAIAGTAVIGVVTWVAAKYAGVGRAMAARIGMSSVILFFVGGLALLILAEKVRGKEKK